MKQIKSSKRRRKSFFPTLLLLIIFWAVTGIIVWFIEPALIKDIIIPNSYLVFFVPLFLALFLTASILLTHTRRGFITACVIVGFFILRLSGLGNIVNLILLIGLGIALEYYFTQRH